MEEEIKKDEEVVEEVKDEEIKDDKSGEVEEEKEEGEKEEEKSDEVDIEKLRPEKLPEKDEEEDEIDPDDEKRISKIVSKEVAKATELNSFIRQNPEFAKYEQVIVEYKNHPYYKNVPLAGIAAIVSSKDAMKIGAQKEREAAKIAKETKSPGNSVRKLDETKTDWSKASKEDFEAKKNEIFGRN